jgi:uncharacterized membrane protein (UPF0127 family)
MRTRLWLTAVIFLFCIVPLCGCSKEPIRKVCLGRACIQAELADSESKRYQGLMFRKGLLENEGMLFIFDQDAPHTFWMKNMLIPLDIIWIDQSKRIIDIKTNIAPCQGPCENIIPSGAARYVLEVNSGFAERNAVKVGERVRF